MIISIEDNYLFTFPILRLIIKEFNINVTLKLNDILINNHRKYGIYNVTEKINNKINNNNKEFQKNITIDIRDLSNRRYHHNDVLKINLLEIKENHIILTCSNIYHGDYLKNDFIKIIHNDSILKNNMESILKIKDIKNNTIICDNQNKKLNKIGKYDNIDMRIMNMNNQNIIYFNHQ